MKMLLIWIVLLIAFVAADAETDKEKPHIYCGRNLANARYLLCLSASPDNNKRSFETPTEPTIDLEDMYQENSDLNSLSWPWMPAKGYYEAEKTKALALNARGKRESGIVDECCYKPCYTSEIISYC